MKVGEKILEILERQSKLGGLDKKIGPADSKIADIEHSIAVAELAKVDTLLRKEEADEGVSKAEVCVVSAQQSVSEARKWLEKVKEDEQKAIQHQGEFTDEIFALLDKTLNELNETKASLEAEKASLIQEINDTRVDLEAIQESLRKKGYEFNIVEKTHPKTTRL